MLGLLIALLQWVVPLLVYNLSVRSECYWKKGLAWVLSCYTGRAVRKSVYGVSDQV